MDKLITFESSGLKLEAAFCQAGTEKAVVITHPHPLYGGDMDNPVVMALAEAYRRQRWCVLRFNFRGTGNSEGEHTGGRGEIEDVQAAIDHLRAMGYTKIHLAGYSFGAWVNSLWAHRYQDHSIDLVMVSPPVAFLSFADVSRLPGLKLVVAGSRDEIAPADQILELASGWNPETDLVVMEEADHFYAGFRQHIIQVIVQWLAD